MKVREVIKMIEADGWFLVSMKGKPSTVQTPN